MARRAGGECDVPVTYRVTYRDIKADILGKIIRAEWKAGTPIPGELDLAATYGVARATVNRAMRELVEDGIIERKRKSGSRVRMAPLRQARFDIPLVRREIEEAALDIEGVVDEGLTWRIAKANEARAEAHRGPQDKTGDAVISPNGVALDKDELEEARKVFDSIRFDRPNRRH